VVRKRCLRPALTKLVSDRALMIDLEPFLLCFVSPDDPAVQWLIKLARTDDTLAHPVQERPARNMKLTSQFRWPPFIRQEPLTVPDARAGRFHSEFALDLRDDF
jgi:hypothetical protein